GRRREGGVEAGPGRRAVPGRAGGQPRLPVGAVQQQVQVGGGSPHGATAMTRTACGLAAVFALAAVATADPPTKAEVVKATKPACGLTETPKGTGTAFCVDAGGYFVTNEHCVGGMGKGSKLKVVLNAGEKDQVVAEAVVVRT